MRRRKFLLGTGAVFASGGLFTNVGAFSSTTAKRAVKIEVVGDENAYLGLREEEMADQGMLFDSNMPRTAPEQFDITNQSATSVDMTIGLLDGELAFTDAESGTGVENVTVEDEELTITGLEPGAAVTNVTIEIPGRSETVLRDTLSFDVTGTDGGLQIDAKRDLALEPSEIPATVRFSGSLNAAFELPDIDNVDPSSVTVNGYETNEQGKNKFKITNPGKIDCEPGSTTTVTVRGETVDGVQFSGTASDVNCSNDRSGA
ncbi:hypothetical protein [Halobacteriaceae bacterium SHR40]|uniref:hypothetical protein n=1 Tax=Halovenus amylolytica TaxID=2500550 RepID=UPI000FE2FE48